MIAKKPYKLCMETDIETWNEFLLHKESKTIPDEGHSITRKLCPPQDSTIPKALPDIEYVFSLTLNIPRTLLFMRMNQQQQKDHYYKKYIKMINENTHVGISIVHKHVYEHCKDGQIHLHAIIRYTTAMKIFIAGVISDFCKTYLNTLGKKYVYNGKYYYPEYQRYRAPSICMAYEQGDRIPIWETYINKQQ